VLAASELHRYEAIVDDTYAALQACEAELRTREKDGFLSEAFDI
jgi:hypothetical protein